jgi:anti-anti-sigma factor
MVISSRTPEGRHNHCPICGFDLNIEPSDPAGDAPCPRCGHLLWFTWENLEDVQFIRPIGGRLHPDALDSLIDLVATRPGMRLVIDFSDVRDLQSATLGKLINLKKKIGALRGRVDLEHVRPDLMEVFRITRLDQVFDVKP